MPTNNQILLSEIVTRNFADNPQYSTEDSYFEFFSAQQVLKKYDLSDEEIEQHLTGSGSDGGCDGIFFFADGELIHDAQNLSDEIMVQHKQILSWAGLFDSANIDEKKVIASQLIKAVTLTRNYGIRIEFNISEAQFLNGMEMR